MNTSAKGRSYEWEVRDLFRKRGCSVLRAAASKGLFDLVVWRPDRHELGPRLTWVQVKSGVFSCAAAVLLMDQLAQPEVRPPHGEVAVVHECRKGCRWTGHVPEPHCIHIR